MHGVSSSQEKDLNAKAPKKKSISKPIFFQGSSESQAKTSSDLTNLIIESRKSVAGSISSDKSARQLIGEVAEFQPNPININRYSNDFDFISGLDMTQTSGILNADYLQQTSIMTSEISTHDLIADATRESSKSIRRVDQQQQNKNAINIQNFTYLSSKSSIENDFPKPNINTSKSRNLKIETEDDDFNLP